MALGELLELADELEPEPDEELELDDDEESEDGGGVGVEESEKLVDAGVGVAVSEEEVGKFEGIPSRAVSTTNMEVSSKLSGSQNRHTYCSGGHRAFWGELVLGHERASARCFPGY